VAGLFSFDLLGSLTVNYTLDGFSSIKNYTVTPTTTEFTQGMKQTENFVLFTNNFLTSGDHTLLMQVTNCVNQFFEIDYITYNPSFATLASKPSLPLSSLTQSSSASTSASTTVVPQHSSTNTSTPTAAITGGVVGSVVFVLLILLLLVCRKRMLKKRTGTPPMQISGVLVFILLHFANLNFLTGTTGQLTLDPFVMSPSVPSWTATFHTPNAKTSIGSPGTSRDRYPPLSASNQVSLSASGVFPPQSSASGAREDDRLVSQIHRLETLFSELRCESAAAGGEGSNNPRVAQVRGRIAELVREESDNSHGRADGSRVIPVSERGTIPPPAYETV
jgi:hypothetical protein